GPKTSIICSPMTSLKTSIKTITYLSDIGCLEIQGASLLTTTHTAPENTGHPVQRSLLQIHRAQSIPDEWLNIHLSLSEIKAKAPQPFQHNVGHGILPNRRTTTP
uniref:hypothetical protein n=2 Tax=Enterobacteriaceae TaxID=543 RepID=UPI0021C086AE